MKRKTYILTGAAVFLFVFVFLVLAKTNISGEINNLSGNILIYKTGSCGCCKLYIDYLKSKTKLNVEVIENAEITDIKEKYGIPPSLESCHTSLIEGYVVEGHMPPEAIDKLVSEKPNIKGIALAGMPSGSPGMPGAKEGDFVIYAINKDNTIREFMRM